MQEENGLIEKTMLGVEDHGILTGWLFLKFDGHGQGFGGFRLDDIGAKSKCPFNYGANKIRELLDTLEVGSWEKLPRVPVRVRRDKPFGTILALGHHYKDKWFSWKEDSLTD